MLTYVRKIIIKLVILFFVVLLILYSYVVFTKPENHDFTTMTSNEVYTVIGKPCDELIFKCCGIHKGDKMATHVDIWTTKNLLGEHRTKIYFDKNNKVIITEAEFQWFYEAYLYDYKKYPNSCVQTM